MSYNRVWKGECTLGCTLAERVKGKKEAAIEVAVLFTKTIKYIFPLANS